MPRSVRQGLTGTARGWAVFLGVLVADATLYAVHAGCRDRWAGSWWGSPSALWAGLALVTLGGVLWSWRYWRAGGLLLGALAVACAALAVPTNSPQPEPAVRVIWTFEQHERGAIISSPLVADDRVFVGAIRDSAFAPSGVVYALDRATGKVAWKFDDGGAMKHMYSSPCAGDGRLYIGEGMHGNLTCKLYCLDADSGQKRWDFQAAGHIESSPCFADGRVYFGAGDDGIYCLDAMTGEPRWHFERPVHTDSTVAVAGNRLYAGSGVSRSYHATEVFCLDGDDGKVLWRTPTDLPAWGSPVVAGDRLFIGLGNGRLDRSAEPPEKPAGAALCLDARTGRVCWRYDVGDAVMARPAVGGRHVYFGSRDGSCYGIGREDGQLAWKADLGSPVVAAPALMDRRLYLAASAGRVWCLDAGTGKPHWSFDVAAHSHTQPQVFSSPAVTVEPEGAGRRVYFGTELRSAISNAAVLYCLED